jgi:hypothetical protein
MNSKEGRSSIPKSIVGFNIHRRHHEEPWMTAQSTDTLRLPEGELALLAEPLTLWERARPPRYAFAGGHYDTSCYRGYESFWSLRDGRLFLDEVRTPRGSDWAVRTLAEAAPESADGLFAHWVHGLVRCGEGEIDCYVHAGYGSTWAREHFLMFDRGVLTGRIALDPYAPDGAPWYLRLDEVLARFDVPTHDPRLAPLPVLAGFPEPTGRWVGDDERWAYVEPYDRDEIGNHPTLTLRPGAAITSITVAEAEALGRQFAVGPGVPDLPFGHLYPGWTRLLDQLSASRRLIHVRLPIGTRLTDSFVRAGDLRALCVEGAYRFCDQTEVLDQFVYLDHA